MNIKPGGLRQGDLVDLLYMIVYSIQGICAKLDDDGGVTDTDYEANCYTAIFKTRIEDQKGNVIGNNAAETHLINPQGISENALLELMYQIYDAIETMTEQLDADGGVTDATYEANCYTALLLHRVTNQVGNSLGNGTDFTFKPGGVLHQRELIEWLYNILNCIETLTEQLDADGGVTDTNYEALWFTATILLQVENAAGSTIGVAR